MPTLDAIKEAFHKLASYCAYQERSKQEVRERLKKLQMFGGDAEAIIEALEDDGFLNEGRFAEVFTISKFRQKQWGKRKIRYALQQKGISGAMLDHGLESIEEEDYRSTLHSLLEKKWLSLPEEMPYLEKKNKAMQFALQKGYESGLIYEEIPKENF